MFRSPPSLAIPTTLSKDGWGHRLGKWGVGGRGGVEWGSREGTDQIQYDCIYQCGRLRTSQWLKPNIKFYI